MKRSIGLVLALLLSWALNANAAGVRLETGSTAVRALELYSSEGCSSCPPADRWFSTLKKAPGLWKDFVPLVFHVDYWDSLGWKDPFADRRFTERQRSYARDWSNDRIYTPGVVFNGAEWTEWRSLRAPPKERPVEVGVLKLVSKDGDEFNLTFEPAKSSAKSRYTMHLALLGTGISSQVTKGENSGESLKHDFVVLRMSSQPAAKSGSSFSAKLKLGKTTAATERKAVAAWVEEDGRVKPIQIVGGFLD